MKNRYRFLRKSYAMQRMAAAIERAIRAPSSAEKERAARWAAAWGHMCGITDPALRPRRAHASAKVAAPGEQYLPRQHASGSAPEGATG